MEQGWYRAPETHKRSRRRCVRVSVAAVLLLLIVIVVIVVLFACKKPAANSVPLKRTFIEKCEAFKGKGYDCQKLWTLFSQAFVGHDPCEVPQKAYDDLIAAAPFQPTCNRMMFWSKTKDVVHDFTDKKSCFVTLENTLLGSVLDGLTWCGKKGSSETYTSGCPSWDQCERNPVRSFWMRASAAFADVACGNVTAMLNGSIATPFSPDSIFGSVELKRFNSTRAKLLDVVLVTEDKAVSNCSSPSFKTLQKELAQGIKYKCTEVTESQLNECSSHPERPCGPCW